MKTLRVSTIVVIGLLVLAACNGAAGDVDVPTTLPDASDVDAVVDEVRDEMGQLATEIENSEAADELQDQWTELQGDITAAIESVTTEGSIDTTGLEESMDDFQAELEAAGDDLGDEVMSAWTALRSQIEQLLS